MRDLQDLYVGASERLPLDPLGDEEVTLTGQAVHATAGTARDVLQVQRAEFLLHLPDVIATPLVAVLVNVNADDVVLRVVDLHPQSGVGVLRSVQPQGLDLALLDLRDVSRGLVRRRVLGPLRDRNGGSPALVKVFLVNVHVFLSFLSDV